MADELVRTIVATLVGRVRSAGSALARRKPPANLAAYECVLRGQAAQAQIGDPGQDVEARRFFEQALALDPDYPRAHAGLAVVLLCEWFREAGKGQATLERARRHAEKAVAADGDDYECQETLGWILLHCKSYDLSEQHYRRAIELNPNSPAELAAMGSACSFLGNPIEGLQWFELARRVDPYFDAAWYWNLLGAAYFNARLYEEAIAALDHIPNSPHWVKAYTAASHALAGRVETAKVIASVLVTDAPDFSADAMVRKEPYRNQADFDHLVAGLHLAGLLPDAAAADLLDQTSAALPAKADAEAHLNHPLGHSVFAGSTWGKRPIEVPQ
jgi:adenylate cyclase